MAITGVNNNVLELLFSTDKNIQDFLATVKPGDLIRGRVLDVIQGENKAIINFKGFNIVSELPQGSSIKPGDIINAQVSQVNDQIFMKLVTDNMAAELGRGSDPSAEQAVTPQQLISILNGLKIPVNEQNIFIAQKLMDYHLPVTSQNINDVNTALKNYLNSKGIDMSATNIETPQAAKLVVLNNMFRLNNEAILLSGQNNELTQQVQGQEAAQQQVPGQAEAQQQVTGQEAAQAQGRPTAQQEAARQIQLQQQAMPQSIIDEIIQASAGQQAEGVPGSSQTQTPVNLPFLTAPGQNSSAVRLINIMNTAGSVAAASQDINITADGNVISVNIKNTDAALLRNITVTALNEGNMTVADAQQIVGALNSGAGSSVLSGGVTLNKLNNGDIEVKFNALRDAIENISNSAASQSGNSAQQLSSLKDAIIPNLISPPEGAPQLSFVSARPDIVNVLPQESRDTLSQAREAFASLQKSVTNPGEVNLQQNIQDIAEALSMLDKYMTTLNNAAAIQQSDAASTAAAASAKNEINSVSNNLSALIKQINLPSDAGNPGIEPAAYPALNSAVKNFIDLNANSPVLKQPQAMDVKLPATIRINPQVDVEASVEALTFLKSRNLPVENSNFVDIMSQYFKDDMKLNQNMQGLNNAINKFDEVTNNTSANPSTSAFINNISKISSNIRSMMQQMSISTADADLKPQAMQAQLDNLISKSGLNQESNLAGALTKAAPGVDVDKLPQMIAAQNNLKAELLRLNNEITNSNTQKISDPLQKETIQVMKDKAGDVLTNLNAIQFINQKPVSYEMLYAQLPILINNNFFNGELQVWYRKGSLKENIEKSMPVNLVFVLNTSNLGNVKISMTIYKKDVECNVTLETEKAKQVLMRGKNDFIKGLGSMSYNVRNFNLQLSSQDARETPDAAGGYVNLGRINLKA
jgi:hypothetical protein